MLRAVRATRRAGFALGRRAAPRARTVWHSGFEDAKAASAIADELRALRRAGPDLEREAALLEAFEALTGDPFDEEPREPAKQ
mmetsp:Transcript_5118/g.16176  ORF Transcript_5118/g.16176 Transcript_5118/m.16176 type:complete len:83 (+) Transcript_5118:97-345(+)